MRPRRGRTGSFSVSMGAVLVTGALVLPASAHAGGTLAAVGSAVESGALATAACQPDGPGAADQAIADGLRPVLNGPRLGRSVTGYSISCARAIVRNVQARGLNQRAATIAVTTAITESSLRNYTVAVDHDSLGLFQQRPSSGWGQPGQLTDPRYATNAFLNAMLRKHPAGGWLTGDIGQICQRVQISALPGAYAPEAHDAQLIVAALWPGTAAPAAPPAAAAAPAKQQPAGPFQRSLVATGTGLGPTDARYDMALADWNGDRRPDLITMQRSGTSSGRTELYVLDGASSIPGGTANFQRLLLHTATALGPTDGRQALSVADWNGDGRPDLVVVQKSGTTSNRTELRVLDGASSFQRYLVETLTTLGPTDDRSDFSVADWNGDGRPDLVVVQKSGAASKRTEVRVLDGASGFARYLQVSVTGLGPTDDRHDVSMADWDGDGRLDLVVVQKSGTASKRTEVRVLDGASGFQRFLLRASTAERPTDARHDVSVADWDGDGRLDLVVVQKSGTVSGRTEARILAG